MYSGTRLVRLKAGCVVIGLLLAVGLVAASDVSEGLLQALGEVATVKESDWASDRWVSPFLYDLDVRVLADPASVYPRRDLSDQRELTAIAGYLDFVQRTSNRSVLIFYTESSSENSFKILDELRSVTVDGRAFEPGLPVLVRSMFRTIDYTNCSCGSDRFFIFAVPFEQDFLEAVRASSVVRLIFDDHTYEMRRSDELDTYVRFLNGLADS